MKVLRIIVAIIATGAVLFFIAALFLPGAYKVERSIVVNAPVQTVYNEMRFFKNFHNWSPWLEDDPNMAITITGTDGEVGAKYAWVSEKKKVGSGSLTRVQQVENKLLVSELRIEDWDGVPLAGYTFEAADGGTRVTWYLEGELSFFMRPMGLLMERMTAGDYEKGLKKVKVHIEGLPS